MSALSDLSAALLPPEHGGPPPDRVAAATRRLLAAMTAHQRAAVGAGLVGLEALALAVHRRSLGRLEPARRADLLGAVARSGTPGSVSIDALKTLVMLAAGAEQFAGELKNCGAINLGPGAHYLQEDHADAIGAALAPWIGEIANGSRQAA